ncbi:uncharacterized protein LOC133305694 [Gastrolobium bilobum]|uniref:uncharacterized protein LOC133305694 n=1 Tax=Gastrolobium bilobum TaxID=150636 RepID=UPI002AB24143|nr:uncharacterized protein LOC133305694 [Gastrolobium bilobum]
MTSSIKGSTEHREVSKDFGMEEDEDLFEIDLEAVNCIPPPHYWESYYTSTGNALLANCLMPISEISCAVPACNAVSFAGKSNVLFMTEAMSLGEYLRLPFLGPLGLLDEKMGAPFHFQFQH